MRKNKLTASSLASAIGHCHFQSRDELILSKIEEKPFEPNPIIFGTNQYGYVKDSRCAPEYLSDLFGIIFVYLT